MSQIKLTPTTVTVYSLHEIMEAVPWTHKNKVAFLKRLSSNHTWGDTDLACITLADFHNIVDYCELESVELSIIFDDELIQLDWYYH